MASPTGTNGARQKIKELIQTEKVTPLFIRLAVHDAFAYDDASHMFGANGSIRTKKELEFEGNEGLERAVELLSQVKINFPTVSFADLFQLAGVVAVEEAGGPKVPFTPGRRDAWTFPPQSAYLSPNTRGDPAEEFKEWSRRTGLSIRSSTALLALHTIGRWWPGKNGEYSLPYETLKSPKFGNEYFKMLEAGEMPEDEWLLHDVLTKDVIREFAGNEESFLAEYVAAHEELSCMGNRRLLRSILEMLPAPPSPKPASGYLQMSETTQYALAAAGAAIVGGIVAYGIWRRRRRVRRFY